MGRVLAVDYGSRRVGLAVSDEERRLALPHRTLERRGGDIADEIAEEARALGVEEIVIGLPLRLDGREGPEARRVRAFAAAVAERSGLRVALVDERLSTSAADRALRAAGHSGKARRARVDEVAAAWVLETFLARGAPRWDDDGSDDR